ncbi:MAG: cytochrome c [Calditrichaeota bacterium]|nr:MAG: cytochrome c [Calditrichota bacterium]
MKQFLAILLIGTALTLGCQKQPEAVDPSLLQHLAQVRERLKQELGEKYEEPVPDPTPAQLKRGRDLYRQLCAPCHGSRGEGRGKTGEGLLVKPPALTDPKLAHFFSDQARLRIIRKGIKGTPMMGWGNVLSEPDLLAVFLYIRTLAKTK